jgi:hypothetical protein
LMLSAGASAGTFSNTRIFVANPDKASASFNVFRFRPLPL